MNCFQGGMDSEDAAAAAAASVAGADQSSQSNPPMHHQPRSPGRRGSRNVDGLIKMAMTLRIANQGKDW